MTFCLRCFTAACAATLIVIAFLEPDYFNFVIFLPVHLASLGQYNPLPHPYHHSRCWLAVSYFLFDYFILFPFLAKPSEL